MRKVVPIILILSCILVGCNKTQYNEMETEKEVHSEDSVISDENGNTGLYIKQDIKDITPTAYQPEETEEEYVEYETEAKTNLPENFTETNDSVTITLDVNIRNEAQAETSTIIGYVPTGEVVTRYGTNGYWSKISYNGIEGFISNQYIEGGQ